MMETKIIITMKGKFNEKDIKADLDNCKDMIEGEMDDNSKISNFSVTYKIIKPKNKHDRYKGFKRLFYYGRKDKRGNKSITDSWKRDNKKSGLGYDLIDLRDERDGSVLLDIYLADYRRKEIVFKNRKEGLAFIKKEFGLK